MLGLGLAPAGQGEEQSLGTGQTRDRQQDRQQDGQQAFLGGHGTCPLVGFEHVRGREKSPCVLSIRVFNLIPSPRKHPRFPPLLASPWLKNQVKMKHCRASKALC